MKKPIFLIVFLLAIIAEPQISSKNDISIVYRVKSSQNSSIPESPEASRIIKQMKLAMEVIEFELLSDNSSSIFQMKDLLSNESIPDYITKLAIVACDGDEVWYSDKIAQSKFVVKNGLQEPLRLNYKEIYEWQLSEDSKKIGDFLCYKATTTRNEGNRKLNVEAWFCSDLPHSVGPIGFDNLPGAILELKINDITYTATKIKLDKKTKINAPSYLAEMPYHEYYKNLEKEVNMIKERG